MQNYLDLFPATCFIEINYGEKGDRIIEDPEQSSEDENVGLQE
jgi:hypothetical protein